MSRQPSENLEEGEIMEPSEQAAVLGEWGREQHVHAWLLLALFELLSGEHAAAPDAGMEAAEKALKAAHGSEQVSIVPRHAQQHKLMQASAAVPAHWSSLNGQWLAAASFCMCPNDGHYQQLSE